MSISEAYEQAVEAFDKAIQLDRKSYAAFLVPRLQPGNAPEGGSASGD